MTCDMKEKRRWNSSLCADTLVSLRHTLCVFIKWTLKALFLKAQNMSGSCWAQFIYVCVWRSKCMLCRCKRRIHTLCYICTVTWNMLAFVWFFLICTGCMRDLRLSGRFIPLDGQAKEGVSLVSSQGVSLGCSSDSCRKNQCSPPFTCVDLWRIHECRYTNTHSCG